MTAVRAGAPSQRPAGALRGVLALLRPHRPRVVLVTVLVLVAAGLELAPPLVIRTIVDAHLAAGNADGLLALACIYLGAAGGVQVMTFLYNYVSATLSQSVLSELRVRLFAHLQQLPTSFFDQAPIGDLMSRCTADIDTLDTVFSNNVSVLVANMVRLFTISAAMVALSLPLTLVAALVMPPLVLATRLVQARVRQAERENRLAVGAVNAHLQESLRGGEVVRAFGKEAEFVQAFRRVLSRGLAASNRSSLYSALYTPITAIVSATAVAALLLAGTLDTFASFGVSLGTLTAFLILIQRFFQPVNALGEEWQTVQSALAGAERIFATLDIERERPTDGAARLPRPPQPPIHMTEVEFGYTAGQPVLRRVSLRVNAGEHVALVGRTGAGKTSALHLLAGLYRPWAGEVAVAGRDPMALTDAERRLALGVVPQVVQLFSGTVGENISFGDEGVTEAAVQEAARIAGAEPFINNLPDGYQTRLSGSGGGAGMQLSAGQQQLLALARALVHRPAVLLFDEATAAVDSESDALFRAALRASVLSRGCAILTVAHRLSTALESDRVIVLEQGEIAEEGPPRELASGGGRFAALLELEAAGWDWRTSATPHP